MKIDVRDGLAYVRVRLEHRGQVVEIDDVVLDTGSAGTLFSTYTLSALGLVYEPDDPMHEIHGVGGSEFAFVKRVESVSVGDVEMQDFAVEVSAMDYGFAIGGILGLDFLLAVGAVINLDTLELSHRP